MKTILAIDPGAAGGIAWRGPDGIVAALPIPETRGDLISLLRTFHNASVAYIEENPDYIPCASPATMCAYGRGQERPACILETLGVRVLMVRPRIWQKLFQIGKSDRVKATEDMNAEQRKRCNTHNERAKKEWKNRLKAEAQRRFPGVSVTLRTCDALLILDYAITAERAHLSEPPAHPAKEV